MSIVNENKKARFYLMMNILCMGLFRTGLLFFSKAQAESLAFDYENDNDSDCQLVIENYVFKSNHVES